MEGQYIDISGMDLEELAKHISKTTLDILPADLAAQLFYLDAAHSAQVLKAQWQEQRPAPTIRVRINVSDSVKGIRTSDTTLEVYGDLRDYEVDDIVALREELSTKVDAVYPPPHGDK